MTLVSALAASPLVHITSRGHEAAYDSFYAQPLVDPSAHCVARSSVEWVYRPGIDFTETNRTHACEQHLDAFLTDPSPETFRALWNADTLASYWAPSAAVLLGPDSAVDSLHDVCAEMTDADGFNPPWLDRFAGSDPGNIRGLPNVSETSSVLPLHSSGAQMRW